MGYHKARGLLTVTNTTVSFDPTTGLASFQNLQITANGMYLVTFNVYTPDNLNYDFSCYSSAITVATTIVSYDSSLPPNYVIKYEGDFNSIGNYLSDCESIVIIFSFFYSHRTK